MADEFCLDKSLNPEAPQRFDILRRELRTVIDSNNGAYSNEVIFDSALQSIANSNQYIDWSQSTLVIPVCLEWQKFSGDGTASQDTVLMANLKNHFAMTHSLRLQLSNQQILGYDVPFRNLEMTFSAVSQMTAENEHMFMGVGIQKEDPNCFVYTTAESSHGLGVCSTNVAVPFAETVTINTDTQYFRNEKRLKKLHYYNKNANAGGRFNSLVSNSSLATSQESYVSEFNTATVTMFYICRIPLAQMAHIFKVCPLVKNGLWSLSILTNQSEVAISTAGSDFDSPVTSAGYDNVTFDGYTVVYSNNQMVPFQVGSGLFGGGIGRDMVGSTHPSSISFSCKIIQPKWGAAVCPIPNCRLQLSMVTLSPDAERMYLANPKKSLVFNDLVYKHLTCNSDSYFDNLVYSNVSRLRKLVILPYHIRPTGNAMLPANDCLSVWSSYGASFLSSPLAKLSEFQVLVSGQALYPRPLNTIEEFYENYRQTCLVNGGAYGESTNSLISMQDWALQYSAYVVDLSRHSASVDNLVQTISLQFKNNTKYSMGFHCFLYFEKSLYVNVETGQIEAN